MATNYYLCPWATVFQYFTDTGIILSGGLVYTYLAGTSTPQATYTDITGTVPNANPIRLGSNGRLPNVSIWQPGGVAIKIIVTDSVGNQIGPTFDQLQGIDDLVVANSALANPASGSGADLVANAMRSYDVFATARAANVPILLSGQTLIVDFEGGITVADGLGGLFYWNAASSAADDGLTILAPTALAGSPGRYIRLNQNLQFYAVKSGRTSRASNTTVAIDPDLQIQLPAGGTYSVEGWLNDATGSSSGGLKGNISFSGSITTALWAMTGTGTGVTAVALSAFASTQEMESAQSGVGSMLISGVLQCTTSGTLSFNWAQESSNATASILGQGSYLRITRLSSGTGAFSPLTHTYNTAGAGAETIPSGASTLTLEVWGASGGGGAGFGPSCGGSSGAGGGSGGYSRTVINVSAGNGQTISFNCGAPGTGGGGAGGTSTAATGTFAITTMTANGGGGGAPNGSGGIGGAGGTATGGNQANTSGNAGQNAGLSGTGGAGIVGVNGTGSPGGGGGVGGSGTGHAGHVGGVGLVVFSYV